MAWQLRILGATSLFGEAQTLHPERKMMGILAYLALEGATHRSKLAGLLWPDADEKTARNNLAQVLRRFKKTTDNALVLGEGSEVLSLPSDVESDAATFKVLAFAGDQNLLNFTGDLLGSYDFDDCPEFAEWLSSERERLRTLRQNALSSFIKQHEKTGHYQEALGFAELLLQLELLSEEAHRQLMRLHFLGGDRTAALKAFERCKEMLDKELGMEPSQETHALAAEIEFGSLVPTSQTQSDLPLRVLRPPLTGREDIWTHMETAWSKAQPLVLRGEPGVGKSRLLQDFLKSQGSYTLFGGRPGDNAVAYSTQSRLLRHLLDSYPVTLEPWQTKELSRLLPEFGETPEPLTSETDQLRFYEAQAAVFQHAFEKGMRAVVIDDLQFFDEASFKALLFILSKHWGKPQSLQTLLAFRKGELRSESESALTELLHANAGVMLEVTPLSEAQEQTLLHSLGITDIEPLEKVLHSYTGGNPLFIIETVKSVLESGSTTLSSSAKVHTILKHRLDKLSQAALRLAWTAAIAQTDFSLELASHATQQSPFDLAEPLSELEHRQIFVDEHFSHDLIFEAALATIPVPVKKYLHKQIAEYLVSKENSSGGVAKHFLEAGEQARALPFLTQAAEFAKRDFQFIDAANFYEQIASILESQHKPDDAFENLKKASNCLGKSTLYEQSERLHDRMFLLARTNDQRAESYHARANYLIEPKADFTAAERMAREGLTYAETPQQRALLLGDLGTVLCFRDRNTEALEPLQEAVRLNRELNSENLGDSLNDLALVLQYLGRYQEALLLQEEAIAFYQQQRKQVDLATGLSNYANLLVDLGYIRKSLAPLQEALTLQRSMQGITFSISLTLFSLGQSYRNLCQFKTALGFFQEALDVAESNAHFIVGSLAASFAYTYLLLGQSSLAKNLLDKAMIHLPENPSGRAKVFREQARWLIEHEQHEQAHAPLAKGKQVPTVGQPQLTGGFHQLLEALIVPPEESLQLAQQVLAGARDGELNGGLALGALTRCAQACLRLRKSKQALEHSREAIELLKTYDPLAFYLGEIFLTHYQVLKACKHKTAKAYLEQTLSWLLDVADQHVPGEYRESFLSNNAVNKAIVEAARREGLLEDVASR